MDGLRPVGSEAIKDPDKKLARILEMAGIKKNTATTKINESSIKARKHDETILHTATASNGVVYGIVQEGKHVYIKEAKNGYFEYIDGIQNLREHSHRSYADALKHLNFMFKDINALTETKAGASILGEGYKLKVGSKEPAPAPEAPAEDNFDFGGGNEDGGEEAPAEDNFDFGGDNAETPEDNGGDQAPANGEEETSVKKIQKLAGKLAQEIRDAQEGEVDDKLAKSVTNTILSATLGLLSDEDKDEISNKLEDNEEAPEADGQDFDFGNEDGGEEAPAEEPTGDDVDGLKLEGDVEEHNVPEDPSPMASTPDHEVHEAQEVDPYSLFETALKAIMEKAGAMGSLGDVKTYVSETWGKMEEAFNNGKYMAMGKLAEAMDEPKNEEAPLEEHNVPEDPSPMSKPGNHEVKTEKAMENPEAAIKGGNGIPGMVKNPAKAHLHEGEGACPECGKEVCECDKTLEESNDLNESLNFLKNKINEIKNRLND